MIPNTGLAQSLKSDEGNKISYPNFKRDYDGGNGGAPASVNFFTNQYTSYDRSHLESTLIKGTADTSL